SARPHDLFALEKKRHLLLPLRWRQVLHSRRHLIVMTIVGVDHFLHRRGRGLIDPVERPLLETFAERDRFMDHEPRKLACAARFRIRAVVGPILGNPLEDFTGGRRFALPELQKQRLLVHCGFLSYKERNGSLSEQKAKVNKTTIGGCQHTRPLLRLKKPPPR